MVVRIQKRPTRKKLEEATKKVSVKKRKQRLNRFFGKVNYGTDGLTYQKQVRKND